MTDHRALASSALALTCLLACAAPAAGQETLSDFDVSIEAGGGSIRDLAVHPAGPNQGEIVALARDPSRGGLIFRFQIDGTLDPSFGRRGIARLRLDRRRGYVTRISSGSTLAIDQAGRIFVGGEGYTVQPELPMIARFTPDGRLDRTFAEEGFWFNHDNPRDGVSDLAIYESDAGERIVATGYSSYADKVTVTRLTVDGEFDPTFGNDGFAAPLPEHFGGSTLALQPDDKIALAGGFELARLNPDGSLDQGFSGDGMTVVPGNFYGHGGSGLTLYPSGPNAGKLVVAGGTGPSPPGDDMTIVVAQLNADGTLDEGFGQDGIVTGDFAPRSDFATDAVVDFEGRIFVAGSGGQGVPEEMSGQLVRYFADGDQDTSLAGGPYWFWEGSKWTPVAIPAAVTLDPYGPVVGGQERLHFLGPRIDTVAPATWLDSGPKSRARIEDRTPTFGFSSNDPFAVFRCRIDRMAFSCQSPVTLGPLSSGEHRFSVRARESPGPNRDPTPVARRFRVK